MATVRPPLAAMLEARSVAVVGASARPGSFGEQLMVQLLQGGFDGAVYPVNPRYAEVLGRPCLDSLADLPEPVDLAILGVGNALVEAQLEAAAAAGTTAAVIFSSCWEAPVPGSPPLAERLRSVARRAGMALCGGNGMGFVNVERRLRACGYPQPARLTPGPVTFLSHSGSAFSALLHTDRGIAFNLVVSSGLELTTTMADYLDHALGLDSTRVVALFLETARDPAALRAALARAASQEVPVVALKVGRTGAAQAMVAAHSGSLAGEDGAYEALFDAYGVLRVRTLDELADTVELLAPGRRAGPGGLAALHDSGGERAHLLDAAAELGVGFARIGEATRQRLAAVLDEGLFPGNPLDAWGTGHDVEASFLACLRALAADPDTAALAFCVDLTTEPWPGGGYTQVAIDAAASTAKPVAVLANLAGAIDPRDAALIRAAGVPVLEGTATGLAALGHLLAYRDAKARPPLAPAPAAPPGVRARWRARLGGDPAVDPGAGTAEEAPDPAGHGGVEAGPAATPVADQDVPELGEVEALALLADYGIPVTPCEAVSSLDEALAAAGRVGWPVALKIAGPGARHKSEVDGVRLGIAGPGQLRAAWLDLAGRHGPDMVVAAMAAPGVELALGVVRDPQFGPLVMVAAGGVLVELLADRRFALPPLDHARALGLLDRLAVRALLDGVRGAPPADVDAVAAALVRLSVLAGDLGGQLDALDVNPLVAGPAGCVAVDALAVPRRPAGSPPG